MKYKIKTIGGKILYEADTETLRICCQQAVEKGAYLRGAYLQRADLQGAYLRGAYLQGADLQGADLRGANLQGAYLQGANLQGAYLRGAYLQGAYLQGAYLQGANLQGANLQGAYLRGADLRGAYLQRANGINKYLTTPMYMLLDQSDPVRAYKIVNSENTGIYNPGIIYEVDKQATVEKWNNDETESCGAGINLASLNWCLREWKEGYKVLLCEFKKEDVVCIPIGSDGKFRVKACTPIKELDLVEYGIVKSKEDENGN